VSNAPNSETSLKNNLANDQCNAGYWYSKQSIMVLVAILFLIVQSISYLTPPFQSPDEFHHLDRAYLLSKGGVFLESSNKVTGGDIDTGLLDYMNNFGGLRFKYEKKLLLKHINYLKIFNGADKESLSDCRTQQPTSPFLIYLRLWLFRSEATPV
jgi:hypothetical protein